MTHGGDARPCELIPRQGLADPSWHSYIKSEKPMTNRVYQLTEETLPAASGMKLYFHLAGIDKTPPPFVKKMGEDVK